MRRPTGCRRLLLLLGFLLGFVAPCGGASALRARRRRVEDATTGDAAAATATAYALPRARILAQYRARGGPDQGAGEAGPTEATTEAALQEATELHLADYMVRYGSNEAAASLGADSVLSFDLAPAVYVSPRNDTQSLLQINMQQGRVVCSDRPPAETVSEVMLAVFHEAFMTAVGVQSLQQRYRDDVGLEKVEILQTMVDEDTYRVGFDVDYSEKTPDDAPPVPTPEPPPSNNVTAILVATLAAFGVFLALIGAFVALRHSYRAQHPTAPKVADPRAKGPATPVCVPTDQSDEGPDDSGASSGGSRGDDVRRDVPTEPDDPANSGLLREWSNQHIESRFGKSVRKEHPQRAPSEKPAEYIRIVALQNPSATASKARGPVAPSSDVVRIDPTTENRALEPHSYKNSASWKIETTVLKQNLEDLYSLSHTGTDPSLASDNSYILDENESCTAVTDPVQDGSTEPSSVTADESPSVDEVESMLELSNDVSRTSNDSPPTARADHEPAQDHQEITTAAHTELKKASTGGSGDGLMIRVWNYDDESSVEYVEDDDAVAKEIEGEQKSAGITAHGNSPNHEDNESSNKPDKTHNTDVDQYFDDFPAMDEVGYIIPSKYLLVGGHRDEHRKITRI